MTMSSKVQVGEKQMPPGWRLEGRFRGTRGHLSLVTTHHTNGGVDFLFHCYSSERKMRSADCEGSNRTVGS